MDRLRSLTYFIAAAEEGSFSAAARRLEVSTAAVARLVAMLERALGLVLFERSAQGLALTADGGAYLEACRPLVLQLDAVDEAMRGGATRPTGTLVVGAPPYLAQHCLLPALPSFNARHPGVRIDLRTADRIGAPAATGCDVLLLYGWPDSSGYVIRRLAQTRSLILASPAYWARHGMPRRPSDLAAHNCLLFRDQEGTVLDAWEYQRGGERETVTVTGWLVSSHRDVLLDAALAGLGVGRFTDLTTQASLRAGTLAPALADWETRHSPPVSLLYRPAQRRVARVRAFVEFATALFRTLDATREPRPAGEAAVERPYWYRRRRQRASSTPASGRGRR